MCHASETQRLLGRGGGGRRVGAVQVGSSGLPASPFSSWSLSPSSIRAVPSHLCGWNQRAFQEVAPGSQMATKRLRHLVTSSHSLGLGTKVPAQCNNQNHQSVSRSVMSDPWWPLRRQSARLLCPRNSPGLNTGVGCPSLLRGIFLTREWTRVPCTAGRFSYRLSH